MMKYVALSEISGWPKPDKILDETGREWFAWGRLAGNQNLPASRIHPDGSLGQKPAETACMLIMLIKLDLALF